MKIAIIDDQVEWVVLIKKIILSNELEVEENIDLYVDPSKFLNQDKVYDVIFLDVNMPNVDGITLANKLLNTSTLVVYVSGEQDRLYNAFDTNVVGYILKGKLKEEIVGIFNKIKNRRVSSKITLSSSDQTYIFDIDEILYLEVMKRMIIVHCVNRSVELYYLPLVEAVKLLPDCFIQINKQEVININKVIGYRNGTVQLYSIDEPLHISRRKIKDVALKIATRT